MTNKRYLKQPTQEFPRGRTEFQQQLMDAASTFYALAFGERYGTKPYEEAKAAFRALVERAVTANELGARGGVTKFQDELKAAIELYRNWYSSYHYHLKVDYPDTDWMEEETDEAWIRLKKLIEQAYDKQSEPTQYKHQCGHCQRFSPLPFLLPGDLLNDKAT